MAALVDAQVSQTVEVFATQKADMALITALLPPAVFLKGKLFHKGVQSVSGAAWGRCREICLVLRSVELHVCAGEEGVLEDRFLSTWVV